LIGNNVVCPVVISPSTACTFRIQWSNITRSPTVPANAANSGLLSSLRDLIKWDAALTSGQLLSRRQQDELWAPVRLLNGEMIPWTGEEFCGHKLVEFGGGWFGFTTCMMRFVDDRLTVIILINQDSKLWDMCKDLAGLVDPAFH
jgi:CubicO group peptidase (beta-lactamase class C family)